MNRLSKVCTSFLISLYSGVGFGIDSNSSKNWELAAGVKAQTRLVDRGRVIYDSWQLLPIPVIKYKPLHLELIGTEVFYNPPALNEYFSIKSILNFNRIPAPLFETAGLEFDEDAIDQTSDFALFLQTALGDLGYLTFGVFQDIARHYGRLYQAQLQTEIYEINLGKQNLQVVVDLTASRGDERHNDFYYATENEITYFKYGLSLTAEPAIDRLYPVLQIYREELSGGVDESVAQNDQIEVQMILAKKIY